MTSEATLKVRLVRCPKCRKLLPEIANVPLYMCAGCDTLIQAKTHIAASTSTGPEHVLEDDESNSLNPSKPDGSEFVNFQDKDKENGGNDKNEHVEFEDDQYGSETLKDVCKKNNRSIQNKPHEEKCERPEVKNLSRKERVDASGLAEYGEGSRECPGYIHNGHPRVQNPSSVWEKTESGEHELGECRNGGNDENKYGSRECKQHESVTSFDEGEKNYVRGQSKPQEVKYESPKVACLSIEDRENESDSGEYGKVNRDCQGYIHDENPRVANLSSDGKNNKSGENELGDSRRDLLKEFDDGQPVAEHSLRKLINDGVNQNKSDYCKGDQMGFTRSGNFGHIDRKIEDEKNGRIQNGSANCDREQHEYINFEPPGCDNKEKPSSVTRVLEKDINGEGSLLAVVKSEAKAKDISDIYSRKLCAESLKARREVGSPVPTLVQDRSISSSDTLVYCPKEELELSQRRDHSNIRSVNTISDAEYEDQSSEFSEYFRDPAKSFNKIVSHVYDGTAYNLPDRHLQPLQHTYEDVSYGTGPQSGKQFVNTRLNERFEMQGLISKSLPISFDNKVHSMRRRPTHDEHPEPTRHHHPVGRQMMSERENYPYMSACHQKGVLSGYEIGGPSEFQNNSSYYSTGKPDISERERVKLLQMVYELLDQLNKTQKFKGKSSVRISREDAWRERNFPMYSHQWELEGQNIHDFRDMRNPGRHRGGSNFKKEPKVSRIPYSGQVTYNRDYTEHPFLANWRYSAPLPPSIPHQRNGLRNIDPRDSSLYSSYASTPVQFTHSQLPLRSGEIRYDHQMGGDRTNKHSKGNHTFNKRHCLPTAGGAPFITCHRCLNLLQLPAEFLLCKGRYHRVQCGSCSELLKFSLQNKVHLVQYTEYIYSPATELGNETTGNNVSSTSHGKNIAQVNLLSDS